MNIEVQQEYRDILLRHVKEGLEILRYMNVKNKNYQMVVVNINNANNIAYQLGVDIENQKQALMQKAVVLAPAETKQAKRAYNKKAASSAK